MTDPDAAAAAVPIFGNPDNGPVLVGALTISGPRARFTPQTGRQNRRAIDDLWSESFKPARGRRILG